MFTTLYAGIRRPEATHTYARSLTIIEALEKADD